MNKSCINVVRGAIILAAMAIATVEASASPQSDCVMRTDGWIGCDPARSTQVPTNAASAPGTAMSMPIGKLLKAAFDAGARKDWATAKARLSDAVAIQSTNEMDQFEIDVTTSFVAINTGDHPAALAAYKRTATNALFPTALTPLEQRGTLKNAMVLCNEIGDYKGAITFGERMIANGAIDNSTAVSLALAYFGNGDWAKAQDLAQKAIDAAVAAGIKPNDTALQIVLKSKATQPH